VRRTLHGNLGIVTEKIDREFLIQNENAAGIYRQMENKWNKESKQHQSKGVPTAFLVPCEPGNIMLLSFFSSYELLSLYGDFIISK